MFRPGTQTVPFFAGPQGPEPAARHHRRRDDPRRRRGRRPAEQRHRGGRLDVLHEGRPPALRCTTTSAGRCTASPRPTRSPRAGTSCASSSSPPARPTSPTARAPRDWRSSTSTASWWPRHDIPVTIPIIIAPGGMTCGADPGITGQPGLPGAVPLHRRAAHRDRRPQRRAHRRPRKPAPRGHGAPVGGEASQTRAGGDPLRAALMVGWCSGAQPRRRAHDQVAIATGSLARLPTLGLRQGDVSTRGRRRRPRSASARSAGAIATSSVSSRSTRRADLPRGGRPSR